MFMPKDFRILGPLDVASANVVSGPPDAENQIYNAGTTYATGDEVWYSGNVFRSKVDSNTGNTPADGADWEDLGEVDEGADIYDISTTYALDDFVVYEGALWKSATAGNLGNTPAVASTDWTRQGATNRFKAFDGFLQDTVSLSGGITYEMVFTDLITDVAVLRGSGNTVTLVMTDGTDGEVYRKTETLQDDSNITDAWEYAFAPFVFLDSVLFEELPPYAGATIDLTIDGPSASVGQVLFGVGLPLATVRTGSSVGFESFSVKERDEFNRFFVAERPFSDTVSFSLAIKSQSVGNVKRRLAERDAKATLFYQSGGAELGTVAYGFFENLDILHSDNFVSDCLLETKGLG